MPRSKLYLVKIMQIFVFCFSNILGCANDVSTRNELEKRSPVTIAVQEGCLKPAKVQTEIATDDQTPKEGSMDLGYNKVSSTLRTVIDAMAAKGITRQNAKEFRTSAFSNTLVKVDDQGNIQTYIYVDSFQPGNMDLLKSHEVIVEIVNENLKIIQGWIPFNRIYDVAQLPFVTSITRPSYGITQGKLDALG